MARYGGWRWLAVAFVTAALATAACGGFRSPADLKFPQILAVRLDMPQLRPGERALIDVLVTGDKGAPSVIRPSKVEFSPDPSSGKALPLPESAKAFIEHEGDDFFARAPDEATVNTIATAVGLAADAALIIRLRVTVSIGMEVRLADKIVTVLRPVSGVVPTPNPIIGEIHIDGQLVDTAVGAAPVDLVITDEQGKKKEHTFVVVAGATNGVTLGYAWFSAVGEIEHYRAASAIFTSTKEKAGDGAGLIVVRNDRGGVSWKQFSLHVH